MSVNVEWKMDGDSRTGLIPEGTYLWDAAKRLGVTLPAECGGRGECDTCAVVIEEGATLLSALTESERARLSEERLRAGERLACQTMIERSGNLVLRNVPASERAETAEETVRDIRREFRELPLRKKIATLAELEATVAIQTLSAISDLPFKALEKGLDVLAGFGREKARRERYAQRPAASAVKSSDDEPDASGENRAG